MSDASDKIRLLVLFGGQSAEHDVSCTTAAHVLAAADPNRYDIEAIGITTDGAFVHAGDAAALLPATTDGELEPLKPSGRSAELMASVAETDGPVVVLPLLHGPLGEDGTVQGLCELANVAFVGAGVLGSALTMDKVMAKTVLDAHNIPQTRWIGLQESSIETLADKTKQAAAELGFPCFVKPANMG